jgi:hypothetical protein
VLRFEVSRSVITMQRVFRARFRTAGSAKLINTVNKSVTGFCRWLYFFFYWAPVASAPGSTAACRLIVRSRLCKFPLQRRERPLAGKGEITGETWYR